MKLAKNAGSLKGKKPFYYSELKLTVYSKTEKEADNMVARLKKCN